MNKCGRIQLAALLWNCHNSFVGSQTSSYFYVNPMPIEHFLGKRTGTMPNFVREHEARADS
jgi:hypothetical protein